MRDLWRKEAREALARVCAEIEEQLGQRPKLTFDVSYEALDILVPRFTFPPRPQVFLPDVAISARVREIWMRHRNAAKHLWSYDAWYAEQQARIDPRTLSTEDFAERQRRRREASQKTQAGAAPAAGTHAPFREASALPVANTGYESGTSESAGASDADEHDAD